MGAIAIPMQIGKDHNDFIFCDCRPYFSIVDALSQDSNGKPSCGMPPTCQQPDTVGPKVNTCTLAHSLKLVKVGNHKTHLLVKSLNPSFQILHLLRRQIFTIIQRAIEVLGQHLLVEALTRQAPRGVPPRKILIRASRAVEVAPWGDVVDFAADGQVDGGVVLAVVLEQRARGECLENDGRRARWEGGRSGWAQAEVNERGEQEEDGEVQWCCKGGCDCKALKRLLVQRKVRGEARWRWRRK